MGRMYDALVRADRHKRALTLERPGPRPETREPRPAPEAVGDARGWKRLLPRRSEPSVEALEATGPEAAATPTTAVDWGAFVFDQVGAIDQKLDAFDETLRKQMPELENRLLHLVELRLGALEHDIGARVGTFGDRISDRVGQAGRTQTLLLGLNLGALMLLLLRT